ncbi:MAG: hypothetical protein HY617_00390 [Candidatus Sungbacteria bacterium]|nr:hypothetical protein [Candidatus Sungbacteria bacterium]
MKNLSLHFSVQKIIAAFVVVLLFSWYGVFLTHKINLVTADLGRHLKNGEVFMQTGHMVTTNFYSYTNPDFPTLNHHWGSGVLFYLISYVGDFSGLELFFIAISMAALAIFLAVAAQEVGLGAAALFAIPIIPLLAERTEVRPEALTSLFTALFFWILWRFWRDEKKLKSLWFLPVLMLLWVNTHIYFFLGFAIIGTFLIEYLLTRQWTRLKRLTYVFGATLLVSLLNPFGMSGVLAPFTIFKNYGYDLVENKSVFFLERMMMRNPNFLIFKIVFGLLIIGFIVAAVKQYKLRKTEFPFNFLLLGAGFSAMAWFAVRNFALFGLVALPLMAYAFSAIFSIERKNAAERTRQKIAAVVLAFLLLVTLSGDWAQYFPYWRESGLGIESGNAAAADFLNTEKIQGPVFNNYDIGGYLIYYLYPREKVFVDNRPEAYPAAFFKEIYIPMQEDEAHWKEAEQRYHFNAIIFSYHDATPWAQKFLIARVQDTSWIPVFADQQVLILLKQNEQNKPIIAKYEISRDRFRVAQ